MPILQSLSIKIENHCAYLDLELFNLKFTWFCKNFVDAKSLRVTVNVSYDEIKIVICYSREETEVKKFGFLPRITSYFLGFLSDFLKKKNFKFVAY